MAEIKNFGLSGIGTNVQLGKAGPRVKVNGGAIEMRDEFDATLTIVRAANAVSGSDVVTLGQMTSAVNNAVSTAVSQATLTDAFGLILGNAAEGTGNWNGAIALSNTTSVSNAVESINTVLGKLVPASPPNFPNGTNFGVTSVGSSPVLASGVTDYTASGLTAGASVTRITSGTVSSNNTISSVGPGDHGTLSLYVDGAVVGSHTLTGSGDVGNYSGLNITGEAAYPASTPGFWTAVNVAVSAATISSAGIHSFKVADTAAGSTANTVFVRDSLTSSPAISAVSVVQNAQGTLSYSSSVPHYGSGASLTVGGSMTNLAGQTYYNGNPISISGSNSIFGTQSYSYASVGVSTPIAQNTTTATALTPVTVNLNGSNVHASGTVTMTGTNVNGTGNAGNSTIILVQTGTTTGVDELSIPVSGIPASPNGNNGIRVAGVGTSGVDTPSSLSYTTWTQSAALNTWDATVVAGVLKYDVTNYSVGYLPVGPNLSGQGANQYFTFMFQRAALSNFHLTVTGTYAGCWIGLPGVSDSNTISPNAKGGAWWDATKLYIGAGVPGGAGDTNAGCTSGAAMTGSSGTFQITFGTQSSTNATGDTILVRFKLTSGQSITALSIAN